MNIHEAIAYGRSVLANTENGALDTQLLLCHVLKAKPSILHARPEQQLDQQQQKEFEALIANRKSGHPVAHLIGSRGFWTLNLTVTPDTLIPRPDTELLVEEALKHINPDMTIADLGTGTGAIALALASESRDIQFIATDFSWKALEVAKRNADRHHLKNVQFVQANWMTPFQASCFDLIVSNPPYIEQADLHLAEGDVRFEPITALASGIDGLTDIRIIIDQARVCLKPGGWLLLEHGYRQAKAVMRLMEEAGYQQVTSRKDYGGNDRVVSGQVAL